MGGSVLMHVAHVRWCMARVLMHVAHVRWCMARVLMHVCVRVCADGQP